MKISKIKLMRLIKEAIKIQKQPKDITEYMPQLRSLAIEGIEGFNQAIDLISMLKDLTPEQEDSMSIMLLKSTFVYKIISLHDKIKILHRHLTSFDELPLEKYESLKYQLHTTGDEFNELKKSFDELTTSLMYSLSTRSAQNEINQLRQKMSNVTLPDNWWKTSINR